MHHVLEIVAGRLIARFLGASLYTWTSVIGVVLAGITVGNYLGGRIADRFPPRKALVVLFAVASVCCVATVALNNMVALWTWLWQFSWSLRVFCHVSLVFFLPSLILGTISPVVAKMAPDQGLATGRTVGDIYAWGAAGSILGTSVAGYYLIAVMGTVAIICAIAGVLLLMAIIYCCRLKILYFVAVFLVLGMCIGMSPWPWAEKTGAALRLRQRPDAAIIFETDSQYSYIQIRRMSQLPEKRFFIQDKLVHSRVNMDDVSDLQYHYEKVYAAVTHRFSRGMEKPSFLTLGGGGYVFPSYIEKFWPGSRNNVVEIDPAVTDAALNVFWPRKNTYIRTISKDARNYIDELLESQKMGGETITYDFIYEDALNNYSVPYQLTTREFNEKLSQVLAEDGIYMVELIDNFDSGLFVGSFVKTLELTFQYVYVISNRQFEASQERETFVVIAARHPLDLKNIGAEYKGELPIWLLNEQEVEGLKRKAHSVILTDDYAPVENLLAPVARKEAAEALARRQQVIARAKTFAEARKIAEEVETLAVENKVTEAIEKLKKVPTSLSGSCVTILASNLAKRAETNDGTDHKANAALANLYYNLALALNTLGQKEQAELQMGLAADAYRQQLSENPDLESAHSRLGGIMFLVGGDPTEMIGHFQRAVKLNPASVQNRINLIMALEAQGKVDDAIKACQSAIEYMKQQGQAKAVQQFQQYNMQLQSKNGRL